MRSRPTRSARSLRTHYIAAAIVPALIVSLSITGFVWAQKQVTVVVDGRATRVAAQSGDVAALLAHSGITLAPGDVVSPPQTADVSDAMTVIVRHAVPVTVVIGGREVEIQVVGTSVADALVAAGIDPAANPAVSPAISSPLVRDMRITVPNAFVRVAQENVSIPAPAETHPDASLPKGTRRVIIPGSDGLTLRVFRTLVTDGVESTPTLVAETLVTKPTKALVAIGTGSGSAPTHQLVASEIDQRKHRVIGTKLPKGERIHLVATGYSAKEPGSNLTTKTGRLAVRGVVAVDPRVIPLGTRLYIPGYGCAVAADTGRLIKGYRIDLCFDSVAECNQWGREPVTAIVLN